MNLRDVAVRARVSTATVSRVLNHAELVNPRTRARVLRAIEELRYHPNANARALRKSRTLGVIVSNLANPYFLDIYRGIEGRAFEAGYDVLLANTEYSPERLTAGVRLMIGRRVNGLAVIVSEMNDAVVEELANSRIRVAISGVDACVPNCTAVRVNCAAGMKRLIEYLHALGHRRIAFVGHHVTLATIGERRRAFEDSTARLESRTFVDADSLEGGRQATRDLLASGFGPTAIVCVNDLMAMGVLKELRARCVRVPEDISVTGFDNTAFSEIVTPALTTVHIPRDRIARVMFENLIAQSPPARDIVVDAEFVLRESTGPAAGDQRD